MNWVKISLCDEWYRDFFSYLSTHLKLIDIAIHTIVLFFIFLEKMEQAYFVLSVTQKLLMLWSMRLKKYLYTPKILNVYWVFSCIDKFTWSKTQKWSTSLLSTHAITNIRYLVFAGIVCANDSCWSHDEICMNS